MMGPSRIVCGLVVAACFAGPATVAAQSMFGSRGLGIPSQPFSARTRAMGGSLGLFDGESSLDPAALSLNRAVTAGFVMNSEWGSWDTPAGSADLRQTRFPQAYVAGPVPGTRLTLGFALANYTNRDFRIATVRGDTIRGAAVQVFDTLQSLGGMGEVRLAASYDVSPSVSLGGAVSILTGSARLDARQSFSDTTYLPLHQRSELSYGGLGFSLGLLARVTPRFQLAGMVRSDGKSRVEQDSLGRLFDVDLPYTMAAGALLKPSNRLTIATQAIFQTWSGANSDFLAQGAPGAVNTWNLSLGAELVRDRRKPGKLPIRAGLHYAQLPFPMISGDTPREFGVSLGSGTSFAHDFASVDLALERLWRSEGSAFKERYFQLTLGLSIRPYGTGAR
jgi:long-subunit fatty acid transport protein